MGVVATIMTELSAQSQQSAIVMIDATHVKMHRAASSLAVKKRGHADRGWLIGRTKGGLNAKLHVVADARGPCAGPMRGAGQSGCSSRQARLLVQTARPYWRRFWPWLTQWAYTSGWWPC